jgi:hypothetical protein
MHIVDSFLSLPLSVSETCVEVGLKNFTEVLDKAKLKAILDEQSRTTVFVPQQLLMEVMSEPIEMADFVAFVPSSPDFPSSRHRRVRY